MDKTEEDQSGATVTVIIPLYTWDPSMFQIKQLHVTAPAYTRTAGILCSTRVRGIEVELTSLLGTPVAICSLSRNEVQIPFSETTWSRVLRLMYTALTIHQMHKIQ